MFPNTVVYKAAHVAYCSVFASETDERDVAFPGGENLCNYVPPLSSAEHDPIIRPLLAKIDKSLGVPIDRVFTAGGIVSEEDQIDALSDLLLGVQGHGVCISDNYADQWERGCAAYKSDGKLPYDDMDAYRDIAAEKLDASGYDDEPVIETAFHWHGGQESALYAFASTREVQSEEHRAAVLEEIGTCLKHADSCEANKLRRLEAAVKSARIGDAFFYL
jgi:hypothetical protein